MTTQEYRKAEGVNFSSLKYLLKSPAHYQAELNAKREETAAMLIGTLTHSVSLEGHEIDSIATVKPEGMNLATKDGKEWKAKALEHGLPIISTEDAIHIVNMAQSIRQNPHAAHVLSKCQERETPMFTTLHGVPCKALIDAHGTDGVEWCIVDLKTTDDASPDAFSRKVASLHYDLQAAFYSAVLGRVHQTEARPYWLWLAVEKTPPYACAVYDSTEWNDSGDDKMERVLRDWKQCTDSGKWPMPYQGINKLPKPSWT